MDNHDNLERNRIEERITFTEDEREDIFNKSNHKCCHCGRTVYWGYGATVDHFIPLSLGGTNRNINLIQLCDKCNKEKDNKILRPKDYIRHIKPKYLDELEGYFDSYIHSFNYVNHDRIFACDEYVLPEYLQAAFLTGHKMSRKYYDKVDQMYKKPMYVLKHATTEDLARIVPYYIRYLKKVDMLGSEEAAAKNIEFWFRFGALYYAEKEGEISFLTVILSTDFSRIYNTTEEHGPNSVSHSLTVFLFSYYSNDRAWNMAQSIIEYLPHFLIHEQGLVQIPVRFAIVKTDKLAYSLFSGKYPLVDGHFVYKCIISFEDEDKVKDAPAPAEDKKLAAFFSRFDNIESKLLWWNQKNPDYAWMSDDVIYGVGREITIKDGSLPLQGTEPEMLRDLKIDRLTNDDGDENDTTFGSHDNPESCVVKLVTKRNKYLGKKTRPVVADK